MILKYKSFVLNNLLKINDQSGLAALLLVIIASMLMMVFSNPPQSSIVASKSSKRDLVRKSFGHRVVALLSKGVNNRDSISACVGETQWSEMVTMDPDPNTIDDNSINIIRDDISNECYQLICGVSRSQQQTTVENNPEGAPPTISSASCNLIDSFSITVSTISPGNKTYHYKEIKVDISITVKEMDHLETDVENRSFEFYETIRIELVKLSSFGLQFRSGLSDSTDSTDSTDSNIEIDDNVKVVVEGKVLVKDSFDYQGLIGEYGDRLKFHEKVYYTNELEIGDSEGEESDDFNTHQQNQVFTSGITRITLPNDNDIDTHLDGAFGITYSPSCSTGVTDALYSELTSNIIKNKNEFCMLDMLDHSSSSLPSLGADWQIVDSSSDTTINSADSPYLIITNDAHPCTQDNNTGFTFFNSSGDLSINLTNDSDLYLIPDVRDSDYLRFYSILCGFIVADTLTIELNPMSDNENFALFGVFRVDSLNIINNTQFPSKLHIYNGIRQPINISPEISENIHGLNFYPNLEDEDEDEQESFFQCLPAFRSKGCRDHKATQQELLNDIHKILRSETMPPSRDRAFSKYLTVNYFIPLSYNTEPTITDNYNDTALNLLLYPYPMDQRLNSADTKFNFNCIGALFLNKIIDTVGDWPTMANCSAINQDDLTQDQNQYFTNTSSENTPSSTNFLYFISHTSQ